MELFVGLGIALLFFALGRELICWYFKINKIVGLLQSIDNSLQRNSKNSDNTTTKV